MDTNVLVYAHDRGCGEKHERAKGLVERLWDEGTGVLSTQVLQEFYVNICRKAKSPVSPDEAARIVRDYLNWEVVVNSGESILQAFLVESRFKISFWDALIIQAATSAGVPTLYSEDLSHDQEYGLVRVVNPLL
ncbi:MAG: PIN domain-containing protein [Acidobacteriota bacterium]